MAKTKYKTKPKIKKQEHGNYFHTYSEALELYTKETVMILVRNGSIDLGEFADVKTRVTKRFLPYKDNEDVKPKKYRTKTTNWQEQYTVTMKRIEQKLKNRKKD